MVAISVGSLPGPHQNGLEATAVQIAASRLTGGLFRVMTVHDFDLARFMLGEEPTEVFAIGGALIDCTLGAAPNETDSALILAEAAGFTMKERRLVQVSELAA